MVYVLSTKFTIFFGEDFFRFRLLVLCLKISRFARALASNASQFDDLSHNFVRIKWIGKKSIPIPDLFPSANPSYEKAQGRVGDAREGTGEGCGGIGEMLL